jgi:hypothetical protein
VAAWIIVAGALVLCLILGGALFLVLFATRERSGPVRVPGLSRIVDAHPADATHPVDPAPDEDPDAPPGDPGEPTRG